jgi:hypothetical protein
MRRGDGRALTAAASAQRALAAAQKDVLVKLSWEEAGWEAFLGAEGDAGP